MKEPNNKANVTSTNCLIGIASWLAISALMLPMIGNAQIVQTVNSANASSEWNDAIWGSGPDVPTSGNTYESAAGLMSGSATSLGTPDLTGRLRAYGAASSASPTFAGDSLTLVPLTELLLKDNDETYTAALILDGGMLRMSPNSGGSMTMAGSIDVASDSVLGVVQTVVSTFTISSTITGSSTLRLAAGQNDANTITFDDGAGTSLDAFAGRLDIGGGGSTVTVDFNQPYDMGLAGITMGDYSTADVLNLDANISVGSFSFGAASLTGGTYDAATLNGLFGNGSQFTGSGLLTVVPEPGSMALLGGGLILLLARRRHNR